MIRCLGFKRLEKTRFFPFSNFSRKVYKYKALVGLGSNIPDEKKRFTRLFRVMMNDKRIRILKSSSLWINEAFGFKEQRDFSNAVILLESSFHARSLLKLLLHYELKFKRKRSFKNAPRTLDLDLLYFSKKSKKDIFCCVPHYAAAERLSVILPLGELEGGRIRGTNNPYFYR